MFVELRQRKLPSGKVQLYLDIYDRDTRKQEALGLFLFDKSKRLNAEQRAHNKNTETLARELLMRRREQFKLQVYGVAGEYSRERDFIAYCQELAEARSKNTRSSWESAIEHLRRFSGGSLKFGQLTRPMFERFRDYLMKSDLSPNSAQVYLARIKTAIHQAVRDNLLPVDPTASVTIKGKKKLPTFLTLEEVETLAETACANDQVKQAFLFSCFTGLRYSDVDALTWGQIKNGFIEFSQAKTGEAERLPLSEQAQEILKHQEKAKPSENLRRKFNKDAVFFLPTQPVVDKQLKKWGEAAGITKRLSFHKSRHTFATLVLSSGVDLYTVSKLLGHKNLQTTQIYAKVVDEKKQRAVAKLPKIRKG